jgi:hypothetical protein
VLTADQPVANYWLHVKTAAGCHISTVEGAAIIRYDGAPESSEPFAPKPSDVEQTAHSLTVSCRLRLQHKQQLAFYVEFVKKLTL